MVVVATVIIISTHYVLKPKEQNLLFPFEPYSKIPAAFAFYVFSKLLCPLPGFCLHLPF